MLHERRPRAKGRGVGRVLALVLFFGLVGTPAAYADDGETTPTAAAETELAVPYKPSLTGAPPEMEALLQQAADSFALRDSPPATLRLLRQRAQDDIRRLQKALQSWGYFQAQVTVAINDGVQPVTVRFRIDPGPRFRVGKVERTLQADDPALEKKLQRVELELRPGAPYQASEVVAAQKRLLDYLRHHGHPYPALAERKLVADHRRQAVDVRLQLAAGPAAAFGDLTIDGLDEVERELVRRNIPWKAGDRYDARLVTQATEALVRTRLFRSVQLIAGEVAQGKVPVRAQLVEAPHRTLRLGVSYYTDEGPGLTASWQHRNLIGLGERLDLGGEINAIRRSAGVSLKLPATFHPQQDLILESRYDEEETDAYDSRTFRLSALLDRNLDDDKTIGAGVSYRHVWLQEADAPSERQFDLLSIPLHGTLDTSNNPLDPTRGLAARLELEPFTDIGRQDLRFLRSVLTYRHYLPLRDDERLVVALRGRLSLLQGASRDSIPDDLLFYAGGGGSVRGYAYQQAGELDADNDPLGGLSAVDLSLELRHRTTDKLGFVLFVDGGRAFTDRAPDLQQDLFWGVGAGVRYYTPFGPLRLDVAVPLDRRSGVDDAFQLYVSLGQAF